MRTRPVDKTKHVDYMRRAAECLSAMRRSLEASEYNAATILAVHAAIAGADALSVYFKGLRHAGDRHEDAVILLSQIKPEDDDFQKNAQRLGRLLGMKYGAEYSEKLVTRSQAEEAARDAERFLSFVKEKLPKT